LRKLTESDIGYILDPINDMVPVCPNCHIMLHRGREKPRSIEELRRIMEQARVREHGVNGWVERMEQAD
jgi:5-methylcytosine-specific restriction protein A